jgi:hypothetical protein
MHMFPLVAFVLQYVLQVMMLVSFLEQMPNTRTFTKFHYNPSLTLEMNRKNKITEQWKMGRGGRA